MKKYRVVLLALLLAAVCYLDVCDSEEDSDRGASDMLAC